jgi:hypothetical protein
LSARFDQASEARYLLTGLLSETSCQHVVRAMRRLAAEIDELSKHDANLPRNEREPFGAVIAVRPWEFSAFRALRRVEALPPSTKRANYRTSLRPAWPSCAHSATAHSVFPLAIDGTESSTP